MLTEVDTINAELGQTLGTSLLAVFIRAVYLVGSRALDISKFCCEEYFIALSSTFEPFAHELLTVAVKAIERSAQFFIPFPKIYSAVSQNVLPSS